MALVLLKLPDVCMRRGQGSSNVYAAVRAGLLTRPIKPNGSRSSVWPAHEIEAINVAVIAGQSREEIRQLVIELTAARKNTALLRAMSQPAATAEVTTP